MAGLKSHTGKLAILPGDNIDTDRIMPARFLSRVERSGYGELLFHDVRGNGFALDDPLTKGSSILVVGTNFGCGSSREHAVWGIQQAGYVAVVARKDEGSPGYSDIFRQNGANCGLALIELTNDDHTKMVEAGNGATVSIDFVQQTIVVGDQMLKFDMNPAILNSLLKGLDLIGSTLEHESAIVEFEKTSRVYVPSPVA